MNPSLHLQLPDAAKTTFAGASLADSLYDHPLTIFLTGDLGAGKTTFLQGFAEKLGISDPLTSPTYALEQRYKTKSGISLLHLDLYRLKEKDAAQLVEETEDHTGIRCIEWADRLPTLMQTEQSISLHFSEKGYGRDLDIVWNDAPLPSLKQIDDWRAEVMAPPHVTRHCKAVAHVAGLLTDALIQSGKIVRREAVITAAELHDLLRFIDFDRGTTPAGITETPEEHERWDRIKEAFPNLRHETACTAFLRMKGYSMLGTIIETHGLHNTMTPMHTIEQKILFYADKRCIVDQIVSIEERFADFSARYANGQKTTDQVQWFDYSKSIEKDLFPNGVPDLL